MPVSKPAAKVRTGLSLRKKMVVLGEGSLPKLPDPPASRSVMPTAAEKLTP